VTDAYDVAILGGGSGGYVAAIRAAQLGMRTAVIERDKLGGTCLHYGCIPTKAFLQSAHVFSTLQRASEWGIQAGDVGFDYGRIMKFKDGVVDKNYKGVQFLMKKNKIDVITGEGTVVSPGEISVSGTGDKTTVKTANLIIATGSRPKTFGLPIDGKQVYTSDHAVSLDALPKSLIILGGGVISVEFASYYQALGVEVTIVELLDRLIPLMDRDLGSELARQFTKRKIAVLTGSTANFASLKTTKSGVSIEVSSDGGANQKLTAERMLVAVGRKAVLDGLDALKLELDRGRVVAGANQRTNVPNVYAVGDVVGGFGLAHEAYAHGILAVESIAGVNKVDRIDPDRIPQPVFSSPQVAAIGQSEEAAKASGAEVEVGKFPFSANSKAPILGETGGFAKVVADKKSGDILGVHMIGPEVTELIGEAAIAKFLESTPWEIAYNIHPHPTLSEVLGEAAHAAEGAAIHM
jgi:dihydrolipoamide dehydrogenase